MQAESGNLFPDEHRRSQIDLHFDNGNRDQDTNERKQPYRRHNPIFYPVRQKNANKNDCRSQDICHGGVF